MPLLIILASQLAPPKSKYIEHILIATHSGEHGVAEVFRALQNRLRDSTWTVVFKSLITVHLMIREGSPDVTLEFLANHKNMLATSSFTDGMYKIWQPKRMSNTVRYHRIDIYIRPKIVQQRVY